MSVRGGLAGLTEVIHCEAVGKEAYVRRVMVLALLSVCLLVGFAGFPSPLMGRVVTPTGPDANGDGIVDLFDLIIVSTAYDPSGPVSDPRADVNEDGVVNLFDLVTVSTHYGSLWPPVPQDPPTSELFPENEYSLHKEIVVGNYAVRVWRDTEDAFPFSDVLTIDSHHQPRVQVEQFHVFASESGSDVTGEGNPDVVVQTYTGGAHCCFSTVVHDLGSTITKVLETPQSNCGTSFQQLDWDTALEALTCDDVLAYVYCCYAGSPVVRVVLDYVPGEGYVPASPSFAYLYAEDIASHTALAEQGVPGEMCEYDATTKCSVLPVVLDYLYSGLPDTAWAELYRLYDYPDVDSLRTEIEQYVGDSSLYTPD